PRSAGARHTRGALAGARVRQIARADGGGVSRALRRGDRTPAGTAEGLGVKLVGFYHSLISDWNHGNAHFLRGVIGELVARGHDATVFERQDAWSAVNLVRDHGNAAIAAFHAAYPGLASERYGATL